MAETKRVFVDTHFLIWAVENRHRPEDEGKYKKACSLYQTCIEKGDIFMISAITVAEFLGKIPKDARLEYQQEIQQNFMIVPFDALAGHRAAEVHYQDFSRLKTTYPTRTALKADIMILGCLLVGVPSVFYTDDDRFRALASKYFSKTLPLPGPKPRQQELL